MNRISVSGCVVGYIVFSLALCVLCAGPSLAQSVPIFTEDFEGLELGPFVDESYTPPAESPDPVQPVDPEAVWTKTPPAGWTIDDDAMPGGGVTEWWGWSFAVWDAWVVVAEGQEREFFSKAEGTIAIADPDEWDDLARDSGFFVSILSTPQISLSGVDANSVVLTFDSSWRPEDSQSVAVTVSYDGGEPTEVLYWLSDSGDPNFHPDAVDETVSVELNNPAGATEMAIRWEMWDAGNDWWWAIDNVAVASGGTTLFTEDFEGLALEAFVDESYTPPEESPDPVQPVDPNTVWTKTPPAGWTTDDDAMPLGGVTEWWGWSFAVWDAWVVVAGDQQRSMFAKAEGTIAIADSDEWDDMAHDPGTYTAILKSPQISLADAEPNSAVLTFDSSWRPEANQSAAVTVSYDGAEPVEVLYWTSVSGDANYHPDATSETVSVELNNPAGASQMVLSWEKWEADNNWWWAIDNVVVTAISTTSISDWEIF